MLIPYASKLMLKILQARLQQYVNWELLDVWAQFRKGRGDKRTRCQIANICQIIEAQGFQKNIYFVFIYCVKAFDCVDHNKLFKVLERWEYLTCLFRNFYVGQEATVKTGHGKIHWFKIGKGVCQGCILSPCFFNFFTKYIVKFWAVWSTIWNQDCRKKYQ